LPALGPAGRRLALLLGAVGLLLTGAFVAVTWHDYQGVLGDGWAAADRAALGASEHAARSLGAARLVTDRVAEATQRGGSAVFRGPGQADLAGMLRDAPQIGSILILDADATLLASSLDPEPPPVGFRDRPYFGPLRAGAETALSPMLLSRFAPVWFFGYARAVRDAQGRLRAAVVASMHADEFQRFQRGLGLGPGGRVGLFRLPDGDPLMLYPLPAAAEPNGMPRAIPLSPPTDVLRLATAGVLREGRYDWVSADGGRYLVAWRFAGPSAPLIAVAGMPKSAALVPFYERLWRNLALFGVAGLLVAGLGAAVAAALARAARTRHASAARQRELAAVLEATGDGVLALDTNWRVSVVNRRAASAMARGRDLRGLVFWDAFPELPGSPFAAAFRRTMDHRLTTEAEAVWPGLNRRLRAESHPREDGGIVIFFRDVTEERDAAARIAESEARLRRVLDNLFVFVAVLAPDGTLLEVNRAPLQAAGLDAADVRGRAFWDCHWWSYDPVVQAQLREACTAAAAGRASRYDVDIRMAGEARRTVDFQIAPLRDADGRITHLIPSATDVTQRREAEAARADSEARFRLAQEAAGIGVFERILPNSFSHWSASMFRLYGIDPTTHGPRVEEEEHLALLHPADRDSHRARREAMRSDPAQAHFAFEFRIRRADTGEVRWLATRGEVVRDSSGRPAVIRGVNYDVTERRRAEERQYLLAREVDHRAKNALAVVQAIVGLTRHADPEQFRAAVTGRIAAMARAHTLLAREGWDRAELSELVEAELAPHGGAVGGAPERVSIGGPAVALAPGAAQPLAMALHELATNAAKYGALSSPAGHVGVSWRAGEAGGLSLRWVELGGPALHGPPNRRGFGSSVIRNTVERQLGGRVRFEWPRGGLDCTLTLPAAQLRWPEEAPARVLEAQPLS
jgi:PAS domain S-box-containing protein